MPSGKRNDANLRSIDKNTHDELMFIQEARLEDIRELKRYQWQSSYYAILAQGGLIALVHFAKEPNLYYRISIAGACFLIFVAWLMINNAIERSLARSRKARDHVYDLFGQIVKDTRITDPADRMQIYRVLRMVIFGAVVITAISIFAS
jgi:hypothetical protein